MCLECAGGRTADGFGDEGPQARGPERPATGDAVGSLGLTLWCPGCADAGYCRRGADPEELPADCVACRAHVATW
jgi:hypothetical protein